MPQLDFFILTSQFHLIFIFLIGYLIFSKYLLTNVMYVLKSFVKVSIGKFKLFSNTVNFYKNYSDSYDFMYYGISNLKLISKFYSIKKKSNLNIEST